MSKKDRLSFEDYRPVKRGDPGYSKTKREYISKSTGKRIPIRQFQKQAKKTSEPRAEQKSTAKGKPRKERADKGYTKADYKAFKEQKQYIDRLVKRKEKIDKKRSQPNPIKNRDEGIERFNQFYDSYKANHNGEEPPEEFYIKYDIVRHPENYTDDDIIDMYDYMGIDENDVDYGSGETP